MKKNFIPIEFLETPTDDSNSLESLKKFWKKTLPLINRRQEHFASVWKNASQEQLFSELAFCIFTPQSKAVFCWQAVCYLCEQNMLVNPEADIIAKSIKRVRFINNKSKYVVLARKMFLKKSKLFLREKFSEFEDIHQSRAWIIKNIKGIGFKEASHFLRNIGIGSNLAILDRHILKNLQFYGAIKEIPSTLGMSSYIEIEKKMQDFAEKISIPMEHLDMLFWCKNTGGIFK
ncbi:MAG: N-glycosylase/DNA lyase [Elusimicrobiota bacterium]|jgi:N-glycosylase/DNA lyase|nr:N-glycosylase/DNA lyase [Elusimicrobiota bacterium]